MNNKKYFIYIAVFWLIIIGGFIGYKEYTIQTGTEILLKNRPVDPRDLFRGDYVILDYEISRISTDSTISDVSRFNYGDNIYVSLDVGADKIGKLKKVSKIQPSDGVYIKGKVVDIESDFRIFDSDTIVDDMNNQIRRNINQILRVEYGIESYFVPEGRGLEVERNMGQMYTRLSVDKYGNAVVRNLVLDGKNVTFD